MWVLPIIGQGHRWLRLHRLRAVAGAEVNSLPSTLGMTNAQSTPMTTNPSTSDGQIKLATDLLASAMSRTVPPNWWGYGMP
jgi:hypothetical protein